MRTCGGVIGLLLVGLLAGPVAAQECAALGKICDSPGYPACCPGLVCSSTHRCVDAGASTSTSTTTTPTTPPPGPTTTTLAVGRCRGGGTSAPLQVQDHHLTLALSEADVMRQRDGCVTTQLERDAIEMTRCGPVATRILGWMKTLKACQGVLDGVFDKWSVVAHRLHAVSPYDDIATTGTWFVGLSGPGRDYAFCRDIQQAAQRCGTGSTGGRDCAANLLTPEVAEVLNLQIVDGRCVAGPTRKAVLREPWKAAIGQQLLFDARVAQPPVPVGEVAPTHAAHLRRSDERCGGPPAPLGEVPAAHLVYEGACHTEQCHAFRWFGDFSGAVDPAWTPAEECGWARIQDAFHACWMRGQTTGDHGLARRCRGGHRDSHNCMNLKDDRMLVRFPCDLAPPLTPNSLCPIQTCAAYLAAYTAAGTLP